MDLGLRGRKAIVCAASKGLGRACAVALAREGVELVITARTRETLEATAAAITAETGARVIAVAGDITTEAGRAAALAACPNPDILVNNAGGPPRGDFRDWERDDWIAAVDANMLTPIFLIRAVVDGMIGRGFGRIVNITSASVKSPIPELGMSNGARAGLTGFVAGLARQVARHNVTINNLLPGPFLTDRLRGGASEAARASNRPVDEIIAERAKGSPAGRVGDPAEFGDACAFLCAASSGFIVGQNLLLDGGTFKRVDGLSAMAELAFLPARGLTALVRRGRIGCLELLDLYIARVERLDPKVNAVVVRDFDRARKRARALDRKRGREGGFGALYGVPITVKESYDVAGLPTTWGFDARQDHVATANALAVDRLEAAGAIVFGKTNVPVGLADWQSYNPLYGASSNPWHPDHTPGGSSGGSAAALAAGLTGFEIGSDIGGSIRVPAAFCGVYGHKPTWGLVPSRGHSIRDAAAMTDISVCGPLARSADDLALGLGLLAGPDPGETALTMPLPAPRTQSFEGLRVALWAEQPGHATDPEITARLQALGSFMRRQGAKVGATARPDFDVTEVFHIYLRLLNAALSIGATEPALEGMRQGAARMPAELMTADAIMTRMVDMPHREWLRLNERRHQIRRVWSAFFQNWDVLLCPAMATAALPHRQDGETWERRVTVAGTEIAYNDMLFWPGLTGGYHLPATVAPIGFTKAGLPIGAQIAGPLYGDRMTLTVAKLLEKEWQGFVPPPGFE